MQSTREFVALELQQFQSSVDAMRVRYDRFPLCVSIETYALCNAACSFCPYPDLKRKGEKMDTALFEKIISDLSVMPAHQPVTFNLCSVNEPFLDRRLFDFKRLINRMIPHAGFLIFTNGSVFTEKHFDELATIRNVRHMNVSLNDHRPDHYERIMRIPYPRTYANLRRLHDRMEAGTFDFPIIISRASDGTDADAEFCAWVQAQFPRFIPFVNWRISWLGLVDGIDRDLGNFSCRQWFMLQILANGREAFCCQDAEGKFGVGDVRTTNALHIYNHPERLKIRRSVTARRDVPACAGCSFLEGSPNYGDSE